MGSLTSSAPVQRPRTWRPWRRSMLEVDGDLPPRTVTKFLQQSAIDMDNLLTPGSDQGFDFETGVGFIQADAALRDLIK